MLSRLRTIVAVPILLAAACQPAAGPNGPDTAGTAVTMPCDAVVAACTPEQLRTWERAEQARIERRTAESAAALVEGTRLWGGQFPILRPGEDYDDGPPLNPELLQCEPPRYQGQARIIGPAGGTVEFGPHSLRIPAGALDYQVVITGEIVVSSHVLADLSPHGLTFATPAILELGYEEFGANSPTLAYKLHDGLWRRAAGA